MKSYQQVAYRGVDSNIASLYHRKCKRLNYYLLSHYMYQTKRCEKCGDSGVAMDEHMDIRFCDCSEGLKREYASDDFSPVVVETFA